MKKYFVLAALLLSFCTLTFAGAKSFTVVFDKATTVGSVKLNPGEYKVKVDGTNAVFTNTSSYKSASTAVKVQTADKKFKDTAVDSSNTGAGDVVQAISVGGTTTKLDFSKQATATN
ncbi:MAG: hypothetical protein JST11_05120 [Acidobacteria bacterium]|nr:hypothetical protein [Acidobacteriota bacterium]